MKIAIMIIITMITNDNNIINNYVCNNISDNNGNNNQINANTIKYSCLCRFKISQNKYSPRIFYIQ